jgi:integrase
VLDILEPLIGDVVERCHAHTPYSRVELSHTATRFITWCVMEAAIDGEPEQLFTRRNIERFTQSAAGDYTPAARGNMRSRLLRMSEHILDPDDRAVRLAPLAPASALRPYTGREIAQVTSWADSQGSPVRRRNAIILLALGFGTGITASELVEVRTADVTDDGEIMDVATRGSKPRRVPFVGIWAEALRETGILDQPDESYLFRNQRSTTWPNVISSWLDQGRRGGGPVWVQPQRMRSTWIVRHLSAGTNVRLLVRTAGVESLEAFTRYLDFVDEPDLVTATNQLTGRTAA